MVDKFVFRYRGVGAIPEQDIQQIRSFQSLRIVDQTPRMLLIETSPAVAKQLISILHNWTGSVERSYATPEPPKAQIKM